MFSQSRVPVARTLRWVRERKRGATRGGERLHLERSGSIVPAADVATETEPFSGDHVAHAVEADDDAGWLGISFSANQNNRHFSLHGFEHHEFPTELPTTWHDDAFPEWRVADRRVDDPSYDTILSKAEPSSLFEERWETISQLRPAVRRLAKTDGSRSVSASPAVKQALEDPERFLVSAALLGAGGTRALGNVKKILQQAYEAEAIRRRLDLQVAESDLRRRWQTVVLPSGGSELTVPSEALRQLGIGFGGPNFVFENGEEYSVWLEFPFSKYLRPDLFVLEGRHDTAFRKSVTRFLDQYPGSFFRDVVEEWESGFVEGALLGDFEGKESGGPSPEQVRNFLTGLAEHLKPGLVVESKEEPGEVDETREQVERYETVFSRQEVLLLTWFGWRGSVPGRVHVIDEFDVGERSASELATLVRTTT